MLKTSTIATTEAPNGHAETPTAPESPPQAAQAPQERLNESDLKYHARVIAMLQELPQIQQQIQQLQQRAVGIGGARESWAQHITEEYRLGEQDEITAEGTIVRSTGSGSPSIAMDR